MEFNVTQVEKYGVVVWQHPEMDELRHSQCLCLNCKKMEICEIAKIGYAMCTKYHVAYAMTRCPVFEDKNG